MVCFLSHGIRINTYLPKTRIELFVGREPFEARLCEVENIYEFFMQHHL